MVAISGCGYRPPRARRGEKLSPVGWGYRGNTTASRRDRKRSPATEKNLCAWLFVHSQSHAQRRATTRRAPRTAARSRANARDGAQLASTACALSTAFTAGRDGAHSADVSHHSADDDYLTTQEAAALLRCSVSLLARDRDRRTDLPPYVRLGKRVVYRRADIERWVDAQQNGAE